MGRATTYVKSFKFTTVLPSSSLAAGPGPPVVEVRLEGTSLAAVATLNPKTVEKARRVVRENGPDKVVVVLQGRLLPGSTPGEPLALVDAGVTAQVKVPRPTVT
jgi:hypothetical protein